MKTEIPKDVLELVEKLEDRNPDVCSELDEAIHEAKGAEAAAINNEGLISQVEYLLTCCSKNEVLEMLRNIEI